MTVGRREEGKKSDRKKQNQTKQKRGKKKETLNLPQDKRFGLLENYFNQTEKKPVNFFFFKWRNFFGGLRVCRIGKRRLIFDLAPSLDDSPVTLLNLNGGNGTLTFT